MVTSPHNERVKKLRRLYARRHRERTGLTLVEGWRALDGLWRAGAAIREVWVAGTARPPQGQEDIWERLHPVPRVTASEAVMKVLADTAAPQGVVAVVEVPGTSLDQLLGAVGTGGGPAAGRAGMVLVLDGLQDPGNAGALVRTALATGVAGLATTPGTVDLYSPRALRGAAGLTPACPIAADVDPDLLAGRLLAAGFQLAVLDVEAELSPFQMDWRKPFALVVGSEAAGPGPAWFQHAVERVRIPMCPPVESLNAAVSAAVCLYEAARQRGTFAGGPAR